MKKFTIIVICYLYSALPAAQTTGGNDFISRATSSNDSFNCFFVAQSAFPTTLVGDDYKVQPFIQPLNIFTISGLGLITNNEADNILSDANDLINTDNGNDDVSCRVELRRSGNVSGLTAPATVIGGVITTNADLDTMRNATGNSRGDVLVVAGLSFCGGTGNFNGCASAGRSMVININSARDSTWPHEFGHVQGLPHRPSSGSDCLFGSGNRNIMYPTGCSGRNRINTTECTAYFTEASC